MVTYKVTTELKTPWWLKVLRFFKIRKPRQEFSITFCKDVYKKGDILNPTNKELIKVLGYEGQKKSVFSLFGAIKINNKI